MPSISLSNAADDIANGIWLILLTLGTIFGCWMFCQIPYGDNPSDGYAVIIFKVMIGITFGFVLSGFIVIPLRDAMKPLIYKLHKHAMEIPPRLRRVCSLSRSAARLPASMEGAGATVVIRFTDRETIP